MSTPITKRDLLTAFRWNPARPITSSPEWFFAACAARKIWPESDGTLTVFARYEEGVKPVNISAAEGDWILIDSDLYIHVFTVDKFRSIWEDMFGK